MVQVRRYFMEITSIDTYKDEDLAYALNHLMPAISVKLHRSSIIDVRPPLDRYKERSMYAFARLGIKTKEVNDAETEDKKDRQ